MTGNSGKNGVLHDEPVYEVCAIKKRKSIATKPSIYVVAKTIE